MDGPHRVKAIPEWRNRTGAAGSDTQRKGGLKLRFRRWYINLVMTRSEARTEEWAAQKQDRISASEGLKKLRDPGVG